MTYEQSVKRDSGYRVTEQGLFDLLMAPICACNPRLTGLLIECPDCGTVYGTLRESTGRLMGLGESKRR